MSKPSSLFPFRFKRRTIRPGWHLGVFRQGNILIFDLVKLRLEVAYAR